MFPFKFASNSKEHNMKSYTLTKAEIQIMNILWEKPEGACVHDIIEEYAEPLETEYFHFPTEVVHDIKFLAFIVQHHSFYIEIFLRSLSFTTNCLHVFSIFSKSIELRSLFTINKKIIFRFFQQGYIIKQTTIRSFQWNNIHFFTNESKG